MMTFAPSVKMLQESEAYVLWLWTLLLCKRVEDGWAEIQLLTLCLDGLHSCAHDNNILMACCERGNACLSHQRPIVFHSPPSLRVPRGGRVVMSLEGRGC